MHKEIYPEGERGKIRKTSTIPVTLLGRYITEPLNPAPLSPLP